MAISLKDHRFNRLQDCCLSLLYHLDDITGYLSENSGILNDMAILDRGFLEMELLKPIYAAIALTGLHITKPFQTLLADKETTYSTLLNAFKLLYDDLTCILLQTFLTTEKIVTFISNEIFERSCPEECVLEYLGGCINSYPIEIEKLMTIILPKFAYGFDYQRGAIFGFGPSAELEPRGGVMRIKDVDEDTLKTLDDNVPVHNLAQERNVGCVNYGLSISGKDNLQTVSRRHVIKSAMNLIEKHPPSSFRKFKHQATEIKKLTAQFNEKMALLQEEGYDKSVLLNAKRESNKLKDLTTLKRKEPQGPFSSVKDVRDYLLLPMDDKERNERLYIEVRYARMTSSTLKETAAVFRLKRNGKNLPTAEYADNLVKYFDDTESVGTLSMDDLNFVLSKMIDNGNDEAEQLLEIQQGMLSQGKATSDKIVEAPQIEREGFKVSVDDPIAAVWLADDSNEYEWHLGFVDRIIGNDKVMVRYFTKASRDGVRWNAPEEDNIHATFNNQLLCKLNDIAFISGNVIRCTLSNKQLKNISLCFDRFLKTV